MTGTFLTIQLQVQVYHPYDGEVLPRELAARAMYEIQDSVKEIVERQASPDTPRLIYVGCQYGLKGKR